MKSICIDGQNIGLKYGTGVATYGRNLLSAASGLGFQTQVLFGPDTFHPNEALLNEAIMAGSPRVAKPDFKQRISRDTRTFMSQFGQTATPVLPSGAVIWPEGRAAPAEVLWAARDFFNLSRRCFRNYQRLTPLKFASDSDQSPSLMHWTSPTPAFAAGKPNIYTIHDLIPLRLPSTTQHDRDNFLKLHREIVKKADAIIVVSDFTKNDVIHLLGAPEDKVFNTYQSIDLDKNQIIRSDLETSIEIERVFNLGWKEYFLHFGAIEPKKNLGRLTESYLLSGSRTPLIIVGAPGWLSNGETALLRHTQREQISAADRIHQYEYTSAGLMTALIRGAKAVLFPSLFEGFGLPVLEAMSLSTAVLTSREGALAEVAGDAALLINPYDVQSISNGIKALDMEQALVSSLEEKGRHQAQKFSLQNYKSRLNQVYDLF